MSRTRVTTTVANCLAPEAAGTLYTGTVMHQRLKPFGHRFSYSVFSLLVDLDRLSELDAQTFLLSVNRPGAVAFYERDHVEKEGETLRQYANRLLRDAGFQTPAHRILMLAYPRVFGYAFNPISVYFAYDKNGTLIALVYAVRNTFGERHSYVAPILNGESGPAGIRQTRAKVLHVSPFIEMSARYFFRILPPGKTVRLRILEDVGGEPVLAATFNGDAEHLDNASLAACLIKFPLMTLKVMFGIHWQALRLWFKGAKFHRSPPPPSHASYRDN